MSHKHKRAAEKIAYKIRREERAAERKANTQRKRPKPAFTELKPRVPLHVESDAMQYVRNLPSHNNGADPLYVPPSQAVEPTERDIQAKKVSDALKTQIAPLYPKGPYQLITSPELPKMFNKKDGGL